MNRFKKFCLQSGESTREKTTIYVGARELGYKVTSSKICPKDHIPIGDVQYCEVVTPNREAMFIDLYPEFLKDHFHRQIVLAWFGPNNEWMSRKRGFLKRADQWKPDFKSRIVERSEIIENNYYYWSEPVAFLQEWRYYIAEGKLITTGWYDGSDEDEAAPDLNINWPSDYNGAVDFGRLDDGKIALVEAHAPCACGLDGENQSDYCQWQYKDWES